MYYSHSIAQSIRKEVFSIPMKKVTVSLSDGDVRKLDFIAKELEYLGRSDTIRRMLEFFYNKKFPAYKGGASTSSRLPSQLEKRMDDISDLTNEQICEMMGGEVEGTKCAIYYTDGGKHPTSSGWMLNRQGLKFELSLAAERYEQQIFDKGNFSQFAGKKLYKEYAKDHPDDGTPPK